MIFFVVVSVLLFAAGLKILAILTCGWCKSNVCLNGKTAIVTGGNSGIGYEIALGLAAKGCRVIIADKYDASVSIAKIIKESHNTNIIYRSLDLCSFESIRKFTNNIILTEQRLDILINNAGIAATNIVVTEDGIQRTMQVNYFGPFLLTYLLTDLLKKSAPSRIIFATSMSAMLNDLSLKNLNPTQHYYKHSGISSGIYGNSKFCDILAAIGFAEKLRSYGVTANSACPGAVNSQIYKTASKEQGTFFSIDILSFISKFFGKTPQEGAQTAIYLACANEVENITGRLFKDCTKLWLIPFKAYDKKFRDAIWEETERLVQIRPHEKI